MNKKGQIVGIFLVLAVVLLASCTPQSPAPAAAPVPSVPKAAAAPAAVAAAPVAPTKPAWQEEWDRTLAAAKKEGKVTVNTSGGVATRSSVIEIAQAQGMKAEVVGMRTEEFLTRVLAERRAGLYLSDIWIGGLPPAMVRKDRPAGLLEPLSSAFILPDVTDPELIKKIWFKGGIPWANDDHTVLVMALTGRTPIVVNTNLVKEGEVKSWRDVLNPKWKGKVVLGDPTVAGAGQMGIAAIDVIMGWDYVKELAKIEPVVLRDQRQQMEWVAQGKVAIVVSPQPEQVATFLKLGAPVKGIVPTEGSWVSPGSSALSWIGKAPNPNASKVFINWLLGKEAQTILAVATGVQSTRLDVPTNHLRPEDIRTEGANYISAYGEQFLNKRDVTDKLAKDLFSPLMGK